jgi:hypothetical protein
MKEEDKNFLIDLMGYNIDLFFEQVIMKLYPELDVDERSSMLLSNEDFFIKINFLTLSCQMGLFNKEKYTELMEKVVYGE